jgi:glycosyltransferase involved in cell wall biosynthesis
VSTLNIIFLRSNPVDPDSRVEKEVNALLKAGHSIKILAWDRSSKYRLKKTTLCFENGEAEIYRFGIPATFGGGIKKNLLPLLKFQLSIYQWLKKNINSFDAIHACDFDTAFTSSKIAFKFKKKFIYDIFDYYVDAFNVPSRIKALIEKMDHAIINNADAVIVCTEKRKEQIAGTNPRKLVIIHNTPPNYDGEEFGTLNLSKDKVKIVYVGILDEGRLIKETAEIVKSNLDYEYHVAGFGRLAPLLEEMSIKYDNIFFYGKIPYNQTLELEYNCDIMTALYDPQNPNNYYAAPNKFYEALMLGKPLIMVKNTGLDQIVIDNDIGVVIDYDIDSLKKELLSLVSRKNEWDNMGKKMRILYKSSYSWNEMERRLVDIYNRNAGE